MLTSLRELEAREDELTKRLSRAPMDIPDIHPNVAGIYRRKVERFAEALQHPQKRDEAADAIRALIDRITPTPGPKRGEIAATPHGDLGTILEWMAQKANTPGRDGAGVSVSVLRGRAFGLMFNLGQRRLQRGLQYCVFFGVHSTRWAKLLAFRQLMAGDSRTLALLEVHGSGATSTACDGVEPIEASTASSL